MKSARTIPAVVVGLTVVTLMLSACTPTSPSQTPAPTGAPTVAPADATPTPTPTSASASAPVVRVPLTCAGLFTESTASTLVGTPVTAKVDETTVPSDIYGAGALQRGILNCTWGGKDMTDSGYDQSLSIYVDPDGSADFPKNLGWLKTHLDQKPTLNAYGDQSVSYCHGGGGFDCDADVMVGPYWMTLQFRDINSADKVTSTKANASFKQAVSTVVSALQGADAPTAAWTPPAGADSSFCNDNEASLKQVRKAIAAPGLVNDSDPPDSGTEVQNLAEFAGPLAYCAWYQDGGKAVPKHQTSYAGFTVLQGGGWLLPQLLAAPPTNWYVGKYKPVTIAGTTGAVMACNSADCNTIVGIGRNAFAIGLDDEGTTKNLAYVAALVKVLASDQ